MIVFLLCIVVLLVGLTTAAVMGRIGGFMAEPTSSQAFSGLPAGPLSSDDIGQLRFDQGLRGYRMDQVDEVIDALGARLRELEARTETETETETQTESENETETASLPASDASLTAAGGSPGVSGSDGPGE